MTRLPSSLPSREALIRWQTRAWRAAMNFCRRLVSVGPGLSQNGLHRLPTGVFARRAREQGFPISSRQTVWLHGFPIHQTAAAQTRFVVACSSTGFTVSRFTSRGHHVCNSGPVSLHDQAVAPAVGSGRLHRTNQAFKTELRDSELSHRHMSR